MEQDVCLFSRKRMEMSGIEEVAGFTEEMITVSSSLGMITVEGHGMKIESFSVESGKIVINGEIDSMCYYSEDSGGSKKGFWSRLMK